MQKPAPEEHHDTDSDGEAARVDRLPSRMGAAASLPVRLSAARLMRQPRPLQFVLVASELIAAAVQSAGTDLDAAGVDESVVSRRGGQRQVDSGGRSHDTRLVATGSSPAGSVLSPQDWHHRDDDDERRRYRGRAGVVAQAFAADSEPRAAAGTAAAAAAALPASRARWAGRPSAASESAAATAVDDAALTLALRGLRRQSLVSSLAAAAAPIQAERAPPTASALAGYSGTLPTSASVAPGSVVTVAQSHQHAADRQAAAIAATTRLRRRHGEAEPAAHSFATTVLEPTPHIASTAAPSTTAAEGIGRGRRSQFAGGATASRRFSAPDAPTASRWTEDCSLQSSWQAAELEPRSTSGIATALRTTTSSAAHSSVSPAAAGPAGQSAYPQRTVQARAAPVGGWVTSYSSAASHPTEAAYGLDTRPHGPAAVFLAARGSAQPTQTRWSVTSLCSVFGMAAAGTASDGVLRP